MNRLARRGWVSIELPIWACVLAAMLIGWLFGSASYSLSDLVGLKLPDARFSPHTVESLRAYAAALRDTPDALWRYVAFRGIEVALILVLTGILLGVSLLAFRRRWLAALSLGYGLADLIENALLDRLLLGSTEPSGQLVVWASAATAMKLFCLIAAASSMAIAGGAMMASRDREKN